MSKLTYERAMIRICFWIFLSVALPSLAVEGKCVKSLSVENPDLFHALQDQILDLEFEHEHLIASLYNFQDDKSAPRPFAHREGVRYHYLKKHGEKWLEKGSALLADLASKKTTRNQLSLEDRELADATLLYSVLEWSFEKADLADETKRIERLGYQKQIVALEIQIEGLRAKAGLRSFEAMRLFKNEDLEKFEIDLKAAEELKRNASARMEEIGKLLITLGRAEVYAWTRLRLNTFAPHIYDFWRGLGYTEIPYE